MRDVAMRSFKLMLPLALIGAGLAACSSDSRSGYTQSSNATVDYYQGSGTSGCSPDYTQAYSANDWLNHKSNSYYWQKRNAGC
jgi:hypothetical protein